MLEIRIELVNVLAPGCEIQGQPLSSYRTPILTSEEASNLWTKLICNAAKTNDDPNRS